MSKINLVYWQEKNFGDALSPVIVEKLSGQRTRLKAAYINRFRKFIKGMLYFSWKEISCILFPWQSNILAVGSIITCGNSRSQVWGAGFMSSYGAFKGGRLYAVRGPYTAKRILDQGFLECDTYGDPALLLPLLMCPSTIKKHELGIVPHWKEAEKFIQSYGNRFKVIDLRTEDVKKVVLEITSCKYILSSSLHGLIVSHAYGIPALWIKDGYIETDGFKFSDYFASVGITEYNGFMNVEGILSSENSWRNLFKHHIDKASIQESLVDIQKGLLKSAPFPIKDKYKIF